MYKHVENSRLKSSAGSNEVRSLEVMIDGRMSNNGSFAVRVSFDLASIILYTSICFQQLILSDRRLGNWKSTIWFVRWIFELISPSPWNQTRVQMWTCRRTTTASSWSDPGKVCWNYETMFHAQARIEEFGRGEKPGVWYGIPQRDPGAAPRYRAWGSWRVFQNKIF